MVKIPNKAESILNKLYAETDTYELSQKTLGEMDDAIKTPAIVVSAIKEKRGTLIQTELQQADKRAITEAYEHANNVLHQIGSDELMTLLRKEVDFETKLDTAKYLGKYLGEKIADMITEHQVPNTDGRVIWQPHMNMSDDFERYLINAGVTSHGNEERECGHAFNQIVDRYLLGVHSHY